MLNVLLNKHNMKKVQKNSLGFDVPVQVYESFDEAAKAAGSIDAPLEELNNNLYYRGGAVEARDLVASAVEALTGIKRPTAPVMEEYEENGEKKTRQAKEKDGTPIVEYVGLGGTKYSDSKYVDYAVAQSKQTIEQLQAGVTDHINKITEGKGIVVDIRRAERAAPKPKTLPAKFKESAEKCITTKNDKGVPKVDIFAKAYEKMFGAPLAPKAQKDGKWDAELLGWEMKAFLAKQEADQLAALS